MHQNSLKVTEKTHSNILILDDKETLNQIRNMVRYKKYVINIRTFISINRINVCLLNIDLFFLIVNEKGFVKINTQHES
jgi:hypothetical protein